MSKYVRRSSQLIRNENEEYDGEQTLERQALIDDQELNDDDINLFSAPPYDIRKRQSANKNKDDYELRNLKSSPNGFNKTRDLISEPVVEFTHYDIQPGDSLQSICLRFACPLNQVKRFNGLMNDQDFHALRTIKLPLGKFGLLDDYLKSKQVDNNSASTNQVSHQTRPKTTINSPGSALFVSTRHTPQFKPLLSPEYSNGRLNNTNKNNDDHSPTLTDGTTKLNLSHSHSFSSLRDYQTKDEVNIDIGHQVQHINGENYYGNKTLKHQNFIRAELENSIDNQQCDIDDFISTGISKASTDNVGKVFQDLDYHVERAKAVAETYDQRATELVNQINDHGSSLMDNIRQARVSKIPELFFCNENFGLNYKKLIVFIFVVCFVGPLLYISQTNVVTTQV